MRRLRKLLSEVVRLRDKKCVRCGRSEGKLDCSHIFPKGRYPSMQFLLDNVKVLCFNCHRNFWHLNPVLANDWVRKYLGSEKYNALKEVAQMTRLITRQFLDDSEKILLEQKEEFLNEKS